MFPVRTPSRRYGEVVYLFVTTLGGPVSLLSKMRITVNETAIRQGAGTIVAEGIVFRVVGLSNTEGVGL